MQAQPKVENADGQTAVGPYVRPNWFYFEPKDLIPEQQASLQDVWDALANSIPKGPFNLESMWPLIVRDWWNSTQPLGGVPILEPRSGSQVMFCVGKFKEDLRTTNGQPQRNPSRLKGQPAFVKILVHKPRQFPYGFSDSRGAMAARESIDFDRDRKDKPFEIAHFLKAAISQYDEMELARLKTYNVNLARYIVRRRLIYWTKHGWSPTTVVPGEDELFAKFEVPAWARDDRNLKLKARTEVTSGEPIPENQLLPQRVERMFLAVPNLLDTTIRYEDEDEEE